MRTQPKNCLSSRRRVEFCSPDFGSHEPLCSRSERRRRGEGWARGRKKKEWRREEEGRGKKDERERERRASRLQSGHVAIGYAQAAVCPLSISERLGLVLHTA